MLSEYFLSDDMTNIFHLVQLLKSTAQAQLLNFYVVILLTQLNNFLMLLHLIKDVKMCSFRLAKEKLRN